MNAAAVTPNPNQPCIDSLFSLGTGLGNGAVDTFKSAEKTFRTAVDSVRPAALKIASAIIWPIFATICLFTIILIWILVLSGVMSWVGGIVLTVFFIILTYFIICVYGRSLVNYLGMLIEGFAFDIAGALHETTSIAKNTVDTASHNAVNALDKCLPSIFA